MIEAILRLKSRFTESCTGNPPGLAPFEAFNDTHDWYEFDHHQYKCIECNLVVGWPKDEMRVNMGLSTLRNGSPIASNSGGSE